MTTKMIGKLTKDKTDKDKYQFYVIDTDRNNSYLTTRNNIRIIISTFTSKNARHQVKQIYGYGFDIEKIGKN